MKYKEALKLFERLGIMQGDVDGYKLATQGWKLTDQLWSLKILDQLSVDELIDDASLAVKSGLDDGELEMKELHRLLMELENVGNVKVTKSSGGWSSRVTESGLTRRKHRELSLL